MSVNAIAFYPEESPLFEGDLSIAEIQRDDLPDRVNCIRVDVKDHPRLGFELISRKEIPIRTVYSAYFTRLGSAPIQCNVDLELDEQPSTEAIARVILAEQLASSA